MDSQSIEIGSNPVWGVMAKKNIKHAWAVINSKHAIDDPNEFLAYGNGEEFQYPVFYTKHDAKSFRDRYTLGYKSNTKVVKCIIKILD